MKVLPNQYQWLPGGGGMCNCNVPTSCLKNLDWMCTMIKTLCDSLNQRNSSPTQIRGLDWENHIKAGLGQYPSVGLFFKVSQNEFYLDADIINFLRSIADFFQPFKGLLTKSKPAVYLHDMWSFTGHCVYTVMTGSRWQTDGKCPYPDSRACYPSR